MKKLVLLSVLAVGGMLFAGPVEKKWQAFPLDEMRLSKGSYFYDMMRHQRAYVLSLSIDRLVGHLLERNGLEPKGKPYGGWEPGCTYAHYLSSLSLYYASTGEPVFLERIDYLLGELKRCRDAAPEGWFIGTSKGGKKSSVTQAIETLARGEMRLYQPDEAQQPWRFNESGNIWYSIHKTLAGLRDAYVLAKRPEALEIAKPLLDKISGVIVRANRDLVQAMLAVEQGGMAEVMADFAALTGEKRYMDCADRFLHINVVYPTAAGEDVLFCRHANDQIPKFIGAAREYSLTGKKVCDEAAVKFWDLVVGHHTLANGGNGCYERFGRADDEVHRLDATCAETCNTYNMLKLSKELFELHGGQKYLDYCERALYNHILASIDPDNRGAVTYYTALRTGDYKMYSTPENSFWCCCGTGLENHAKYCENAYFHNGKDLLVSLFIPSVLEWREKGAQIALETDFPRSDEVRVRIVKKGSFNGKIYLRRPDWAGTGGPFAFTPTKDGEVFSVKLPRKLWIREAKGEPHYGSLFYGPILLAADLGTEGVKDVDQGARKEPAWEKFDELVGPLENLSSWIKETGPLTFELKTATGKPLVFKPYYQLHHRRLGPYWKFYSPKDYALREKAFTDRVYVGDAADEAAHGLEATKEGVVDFHGYFWEKRHLRRWVKDGAFSYALKVDPQETRAYKLIATYWGDESAACVFDILVDGRKLATVDLNRGQPLTYRDDVYTIPKEWTRGKKTIRVTFQSGKGGPDKGGAGKGQAEKGQVEKGQVGKGLAGKGKAEKGLAGKGKSEKGKTAGPLFALRLTADTDYR